MLRHAATSLHLTTSRRACLTRVARYCNLRRNPQVPALRRVLESRRIFSSTTPLAEQAVPSTLEESSADVRDILQASRKLIEPNKEEGLHVQVIQAQDRLKNRPENVINITVCSAKNGSGVEFVSALLDDPLASNPTLRSTLLDRCSRLDDHESILTSSTSELTSPFLTRFQDRGISLEVTELGTSHYEARTFSHSASADIPILVLSLADFDQIHLTGELSILDVLRYNPHALVVIDGPLSVSSPALEKLKTSLSDFIGVNSDRILVCDSSKALRGASVLAKDGPTGLAVREFQEDMSTSNLENVVARITSLIDLGPSSLRGAASQALVKSSVAYAGIVVESAKDENGMLQDAASNVMESVLEEREKAIVAILGSDSEVSASTAKGRIDEGMEQVASEVRPVVDGLSWTKLPFVVDDVSSRVNGAVEHALTRQFGNELMFQTGRLAALQERCSDLTELAVGLVSRYRTPLIANKIDQITSAPSYSVTASSHSPLSSASELLSPSPPALLAPLQRRSMQLSHATRALHLSAQRALLFSFGSTTISFTSGASLCAYGVLDIPSGIAAGALGSLLGLRWAVGSWAKARRRWWGAFDRVGEGLERDLSETLKAVLDQQVLVVPREEYAEMTKCAERMEEEIEKADEYIKTMEQKYDVVRKRDAASLLP